MTETKELLVQPSIPFAEYLERQWSGAKICEEFIKTPIREKRARCLEQIVEAHPQHYGLDWVESSIQGLGVVGEFEFQEKMLSWYLKKCIGEWDKGVRPFRFLFKLLQTRKVLSDSVPKLVNEGLKISPALYWCSDELHAMYLSHFKSFTDGHNWIPTTLPQWKTAERYVRRIVAAKDAAYYPLFRDWSTFHCESGIKLKKDEGHKVDDRWEPNRIKAFLSDTAEFLRAAQEEQTPDRGFVESLITATIQGQEHGFSEAFEIKLEYPSSEDIALRVKEEKHVRVAVVVNARGNSQNVQAIGKYLNRVEIGVDVEGGKAVRSWNQYSFGGHSLASFEEEKSAFEFFFTPLAGRQRVTFTFFLDMVKKGTLVKYFQPKPIHVWA